MGKATLSVAQATGQMTATVTAQGYRNPFLLWVANWCYDADDVAVSAEFHPVQWPAGTAGPFTVRGDHAKAYVFVYPATATPEKGAAVEYTP